MNRPNEIIAPELVQRIEYAVISPVAATAQIRLLCDEAEREGLYGICVPSSRVAHAYEFIGDSQVKVICLVGFPLGNADADVKRYETEVAVDQGAHEIEVAANLALIKDGHHAQFLRELRDVVEAADERPVRVVLEFGLLSKLELGSAVQAVLDSGAQHLSTGTGLLGGAINADQLEELRELVGDNFGIKAGGLKSRSQAESLLEAGADRAGILHVLEPTSR